MNISPRRNMRASSRRSSCNCWSREAEAGQDLVKSLADSEPSITAVVPPAKPARKVAVASPA